MRRIAPAVLLGTAAVTAVALFDPVFGNQSSSGDLFAAPAAPDLVNDLGGLGTDSGTTTSTAKKSKFNTSSGSAASSSAAAAPAAACPNGTKIVSAVVNTRYGPVKLQATVVEGAICKVTPLIEPSGDSRTDYISQQVFPYLDKQAVKVGIDFQSVSGATYTSEGYRTALQSILDQM